MKKVHRLATAAEKEKHPNAYTFNRASGRFHNRAGFEIHVPEGDDGDRGAGRMPALPAKALPAKEAEHGAQCIADQGDRKAGRMPALPAKEAKYGA